MIMEQIIPQGRVVIKCTTATVRVKIDITTRIQTIKSPQFNDIGIV